MAAVPSKRSPALSVALAMSFALTLTVFGALRWLLHIVLPPAWLLGILVFQLAANLLGSLWILTPLGSLFFANVGSLTAYAAGVALLMRSGVDLPLFGLFSVALGGVLALAFIMLSARCVTLSPPAVLEEPVAQREAIIEVKGSGEEIAPAEEANGKPAPTLAVTWDRPEELGEPDFDFLQESGTIRNSDLSTRAVSPRDEEAMGQLENVFRGLGEEQEVDAALEVVAPVEEGDEAGDTVDLITDEWVNRAAEEMVRDGTEKEIRASPVMVTSAEGLDRASPSLSEGREAGRPCYRVILAANGETLGVFYRDGGYGSLDLMSLHAMLAEKLCGHEVRIVGLNWDDHDQVQVAVEAVALPGPETGVSEPMPPSGMAQPPEAPPSGGADAGQPPDVSRPAGAMRYFIYDRLNYKHMGEYVPEGAHPRLDRLTLYRLFPEYDFRTFTIDSIRWVGEEVRIYIRGEKKKKAKAGVGSGEAGDRRKNP